jgi:hypothetical protein
VRDTGLPTPKRTSDFALAGAPFRLLVPSVRARLAPNTFFRFDRFRNPIRHGKPLALLWFDRLPEFFYYIPVFESGEQEAL